MHSRWIAVSGWGVAVLVVLVSGVGWAAPQAGFPDGAFVTGQDGSRWAVGSGARVRLSFATDDTNALAGLRDAGTASTLAEASAALGGFAPPPAMAGPANPTETLLGQSIVACAESPFRFEFTVVRAEWLRTVVDRTPTGNAMWVVLVVEATNLNAMGIGPYRGATPAMYLTDDRDRRFTTDFFGERFDLNVELARAYGLTPFNEVLTPGIAEQRVIAFEVAPDVQHLTLQSTAAC